MVEIKAIDRSEIGVVWPYVDAMVESALKHQKPRLVDSDWLRVRCLEGEYTLLVALDGNNLLGCTIIYPEHFPLAKVCQAYLIAGDEGEKWIETMDSAIEQVARLNECEHIIFIGRKGWQRRLKNYSEGNQVYHREIVKNG